MNKLMTSPRTSWLGILAFIASACAFLIAILDGKPETSPDIATLTVTGAAALNALGNMAARDNGTTSEEAHGLNAPKKITDADKAN